MSDIRLDPTTNDLLFVNGDLAMDSATDGIDQFLKRRLKTFLAEWFLDETVGIPYLDDVFVKNPNPVVMAAVFKKEILETPGVIELVSFDLSLDNKTRNLTLTIKWPA
jgi:hypothetical protein